MRATLKLRDKNGKAWVRNKSGGFMDRASDEPVWHLPDGLYSHGRAGVRTLHFTVTEGRVNYVPEEEKRLYVFGGRGGERARTQTVSFQIQEAPVECPSCGRDTSALTAQQLCVGCSEL